MERLKTALAAAAVLALVWFAWTSAARALASHEERIRARIAEMAAGFDDRDVGEVLEPFDRDFRDRGTGHGVQQVKDGLRALFFQAYGGDATRYRVTIPPQEMTIEVDEEAGEARVALRAEFERIRKDVAKPWWDARAVLHWRLDGSRWLLVATSDVNHRDRGR